MYRMILVDDEPNIRKGLTKLIPWEDYGVEIVAEADSGVSALALIERLHPDFAIVDIQMPHMDGLELLRQMQERKDAPKFIMLSGFDQFDYVRTAMRLGAQNYLLKPVDAEELTTTVVEMVELVHDEEQKKQQFQESMQALMNNTLNRLLNSQIEVRELRGKCKLLNITLRCNHMVVGCIRPQFDNQDTALRYIMFRSLDICRQKTGAVLTAYPVADIGDNVVLIIKNPDGQFGQTQLLELLEDCAGEITRNLGCSCVTALGTDVTSFREIPTSYQNALRLLNLKSLWGDTEIAVDTAVNIQTNVSMAFNTQSLVEMLQNHDSEKLKSLVEIFIDRTLPERRVDNLVQVKYHLVELVSCALQAAHQCYVPEAEITAIRADIYARIQQAKSLHTLRTVVLAFIVNLSERTQQLRSNSYSKRVQYVVEHIHRYYNDCNLSLKTLAGDLGVNAAYLGRQFSSETGEFFSDYLNGIRIQHARALLATTQLKLTEVAQQVGFVNVSYFSTIYKKITGERPGQSRNVKG